MTATISPGDWLEHVGREYLHQFVPEGGAAVKFVVPMNEHTRRGLFDGIAEMAAARRQLLVRIDARDTRLYQIEHLLFAIARQLPWADLTEGALRRVAQRSGLTPPEPGPQPFAERLARANDESDPAAVAVPLRPQLTQLVFKNKELTRDFRVAMLHMCNAALVGGDQTARLGLLAEWLSGALRHTSALKEFSIQSRITRVNARFILESLTRWITFAGYRGLVVVLDLEELAYTRRGVVTHVKYTKNAVLDCYEVLRQCIDSTDDLASILLVAVPDASFVDENNARGVSAYSALKFRVYDEVRDRHLVNPCASLVRVSAA